MPPDRRKQLLPRLGRWLVFALVLAALGTAVWFLRRPPIVRAKTETVRRHDLDDRVSSVGVGFVEASRRVAVQAESMARVKEIKVQRGQRVHAGDVLVVLDDRDIRDQMRSIEASIPVLQARGQQARVRALQLARELDRVKQLHDAGVIPDQQRDTAQNGQELAELDRQTALAAIGQARANLEVARSALRKSAVLAPFDGVVLDVNVQLGDLASSIGSAGGTSAASGGAAAGGTAALLAGMQTPQQRGVVDLADDTQMFVVADFDEADYHRIHAGQETALAFDALGKRPMKGTVTEVYPYISRAQDQNRTSRVKILLPEESKSQVLAGMSATVEIKVGTKTGVLALPSTCVITRPYGKVVWVSEAGLARERAVRVGASTWEWAEIESGLGDGDLVLIPPEDARLVEGARVQIRPKP